MKNINLDKTINETLNFLNNQSGMPSRIKVVKFCGMPYSFGFKNSNNFKMPIEHIGLAKLCYEEALKTFYTKKVNEDGSTEMVFEKLPSGHHVSDCLQSLSEDIFAWYKDNKPLELVQFPECFIHRPNLTQYEKYCNLDSLNMDEHNHCRVNVVDNAIKSAIQVYTSELVSSGEATESEGLKIKAEEEHKSILALTDMCQKTCLVSQPNDSSENLEQ